MLHLPAARLEVVLGPRAALGVEIGGVARQDAGRESSTSWVSRSWNHRTGWSCAKSALVLVGGILDGPHTNLGSEALSANK